MTLHPSAAPSRASRRVGRHRRRWAASAVALSTALSLLAIPSTTPAAATASAEVPTFTSQQARPTVGEAMATVPADIDGDGDTDLATAVDDARHGVVWHRNEDGAGTAWSQHAVAPGADDLVEVVAVDIDGDGDTDLASLSAETVRWHRNGDGAGGGDGSRWTTVVVADSSWRARTLRTADIDGDGDADLAAAIHDTVTWYRNGDASGGGDGTSWSTTVVATGLEHLEGGEDLEAADLDGDGDIDLVTIEWVGDRLTWHRNGDGSGSGDGTAWTAVTIASDVRLGPGVSAGDLDGDGDVDLLARADAERQLFRNDGAGTWTAVAAGSGGPGDVLGDVDGDGDLDLAYVTDTGIAVAWMRNGDASGGGDGTSWNRAGTDPRLADAASVAITDVDGDGDSDLVSASPRDRTVAWHDNRDGTGDTLARVDVVPSDDNPLDVEAGDVDGDGDLDLVTASEWDDDTIAWNRNGDGSGGGAGTDWARVVIDERMWGAMDAAVGDIDGDGDLDVAAAALHVGIVWFRNGDAAGGGDGTRWTRVPVEAEAYLAGYARSVAVADVDGDGDLDLASASDDAAGFVFHRNGDSSGGGDGTQWTSVRTNTWQTSPFDVAAADVDGDGDIDLVGTDTYDEELVWFRNGDSSGGGDGTSWTFVAINRYDPVGSVTTADVDGDGDVDVVAEVAGATVLLRNGDTAGGGDGTAWTTTEVAAHGANGMVAADVDGDADLDLVTTHGLVEWHRSDDGSGSMWTAVEVDADDTFLGVTAGDLDGDGDTDLASTAAHGITPWVHLAVDAATDGSGPELVDLSVVEPTSVDTSQGPRTVGFHLRVADVPARFESGLLELTSPSGTTLADGGFTVSDRIAGDAADGVLQTTVQLPAGSENGTWQVTRVELVDHVGNRTVFSSAEELSGAGHTVDLEVAVRDTSDDTGGGSTDDGGTDSGGTDDDTTDGGATDDGSTQDGSTDSGGTTDGGSTDSDATTGDGTTTVAPSFVDDDGSVFEADIEKIAAAGITRGCNPPTNDRYCPDAPVTRGQMAAFLVRALDLPASSGDWFGDDDTSIFEADIDTLARAGITAGCNPPDNDQFCPDDHVTRQQMAAFLDRALQLTDAPQYFVDVSSDNVFVASIGALAAADITRGCNPPANDRFCPTDVVTRGQMAAFLVRGLGL